MSTIVCVARNYQEFEEWRDKRVVYVGDKSHLARLDPSQVRDVVFVGENYRYHPIYFSDELLDFQCAVSLAKNGPKKVSWLKRLFRSFDGLGKAV